MELGNPRPWLLAFIVLAIGVSRVTHAVQLHPASTAYADDETTEVSLPQEAYWKSELPNTLMPKPIREILPIGLNEDPNNKSVYMAAGSRVVDEEDSSLYFLWSKLRLGKTMNLHFIRRTNQATFLPRREVESKPFSPMRLPEILRLYSADPGSKEAQMISGTIVKCLGPSIIKTKDRSCATSLESMVDFATTRLGYNLRTFNSEVTEAAGAGKRDYVVQPGVKKLKGDKMVVCHKLHYPYAIYNCHSLSTTEAYAVRVPVKGLDGAMAEAVAVCHTNTAEWERYPVIRSLNAKRGSTDPICHFLARDSIVYIPK